MARFESAGNAARQSHNVPRTAEEFVVGLVPRRGREINYSDYGLASVVWLDRPGADGPIAYYSELQAPALGQRERHGLALPPREGIKRHPKVTVYLEKGTNAVWQPDNGMLNRLSPLPYCEPTGSIVHNSEIPLSPALVKKLGQRERRRSLREKIIATVAFVAMIPAGVSMSDAYVRDQLNLKQQPASPSTPTAHATVKPGKTPKPSASPQPNSPTGTTGSFDITIGDWNVYVKNKPNAVQTSVAALMKRVNVLTLQESSSFGKAIEKKIGKITCESCSDGGAKYGMFPGTNADRKQGSGNRIIWDRDKLTLLESHAQHAPSDPGHVRSMTWALFEINGTAEKVWILNVHAPNAAQNGKGFPSKNHAQVRALKRYMGAVVKRVDILQKTGQSVVAVGDWNDGYKHDYQKEIIDYKVDATTCLTRVFVCGHLGSRLKNAWAEVDLSGDNSKITTHGKGRIIDQLLYRARTGTQMSLRDFTIYANKDKKTGKVKRTDGADGSDHKITEWVLAGINKIETKETAPPSVELAGVNNFRAITGVNTIYRSGKLEGATQEDVAKLASLLKGGAIIDLRTSNVQKKDPDPTVANVTKYSFPVGAPSKGDYARAFVKNEANRRQLGLAITQIANTVGPVEFHCTYGKDRSGWVSAMLQIMAGVSSQQVMAEYMKSKENHLAVKEAWLQGGFDAVIKDYGSFPNYLEKGLGVDKATQAKLVQKIVKK